jgi:hypothetical protein
VAKLIKNLRYVLQLLRVPNTKIYFRTNSIDTKRKKKGAYIIKALLVDFVCHT